MKEFDKRLNLVIRHIKKVEDNCNALARKIAEYDEELALKLVQLGRIHDASKLDKFEFENLHAGEPLFDEALNRHRLGNKHHPEHWGEIQKMPDEYLAEMVCDGVARSQDFGTDVRKWFFETAPSIYNYKLTEECGETIIKYLDMLLIQPFTR